MKVLSTADPAELVRKEINELVNLPQPDPIMESPFAARWHLGHTIISLSQCPIDKHGFCFMRFDRDDTEMPEGIHMTLPNDLDTLQLCLKTVRIASYNDPTLPKTQYGRASRFSRHAEMAAITMKGEKE